MRYGGRLSRIEFTALIDQQANRIRASAAALPLYGPVGWDGPCRVGGWGWEDDRLNHAGLLFGDPDGGPWVEVITTAGPPMPLLIDLRVTAAGEVPTDRAAVQRALEAASTPASQRVAVAVDGLPRPFSRWTDEPLGGDTPVRGWLAILDEIPGLLLRVCDIAPADLALARLGDLEPHLTGTRTQLLAAYDASGPDAD